MPLLTDLLRTKKRTRFNPSASKPRPIRLYLYKASRISAREGGEGKAGIVLNYEQTEEMTESRRGLWLHVGCLLLISSANPLVGQILYEDQVSADC